jgi:hypothetical protein
VRLATLSFLLLGACTVGANFDKTVAQQVSIAVPAISCTGDPCATDVPFSATVADMAIWRDTVNQAIGEEGHDPNDVTVEIQAVAVTLDQANVVERSGSQVAAVSVERWNADLSTPSGALANLSGGGGPPTPPIVLDEEQVGRADAAFHEGAPVHAQGVVRMAVPLSSARAVQQTPGARLEVKLTWKLHIDVRWSLL